MTHPLQAAPIPKTLLKYPDLLGYTKLNSGGDKTALLSPDGKHVVICFVTAHGSQSESLKLHNKWVNYCRENSINLHLPTYGDSATSDIGSLTILMTKMERLFPLPRYLKLYFEKWHGLQLLKRQPVKGPRGGRVWDYKTWLRVAEECEPFTFVTVQHQKGLLSTMFDLMMLHGTLDAPEVNCMVRRDGTVVIADPWHT